MKEFFEAIWEYFLTFREWTISILEPALPWLKIGSVAVSIVLVFGIIYAVRKSGWLPRKIDEKMHLWRFVDTAKLRIVRKWKKARQLSQSINPNDWKKALMEADEMLYEILKISGHPGSNADERLESMKPDFLSNLEELKNAHDLAGTAKNPEVEITHEQAIEALRIYKAAFEEWGLI